jgi:hypothetical protein
VCPFCEASLPGKCLRPDAPPLGRIASRAALTFFAAAAIAACGKKSGADDSSGQVSLYAVAPINSQMIDAGPPIDASKEPK